jgi:hypothetical protein
MSYRTNNLITDASGKPVPQYYNPISDAYEAIQGANGASHAIPAGSTQIRGAKQIVATAGTRVQLPDFPCREVTLIGLKTNAGSIYVGGSDVSQTVYGAELQAKNSLTLAVKNTNMVYIDTSVSGEGVSYVAI